MTSYDRSILCTSCGEAISIESNSYYKCRECKLHYICKKCSNVQQIHTLMEITKKQNEIEKLSTKLASANVATAPETSIFERYDYLTMPTGYCEHCLTILHPNKDRYYSCQQCPNGFDICTKCINLMKTEHAPQHTFKKDNYSMDEHMLMHYNTSCDGCKTVNFKGIRYQCDECRQSYDLCESCYHKANELHPNHEFKIVQSPWLQLSNRILLARRAIQVLKKFPNQQYDPLTGYTLQDAQQVKEQEEKNLDQFWQQRLKEAKDAREHQRQMHRIQMDSLHNIRALIDPNYHIMQMRHDDDYY
ncbi:unnamed protein product [Rotaria sordida]|uniref:ZZ-type domain-containing protein n=1 Tax=Rotaria sordida TaxID=392033 RepID=A0A819HJP4_9BILA|nr:unnamed protein product [Rotaria sordida]CAF1325419.1 unnamed protein product [Rotaria sordida]CAF3784397.1 unnamed protein product [Rotaria sordida]CAF3898414.1 unnamed protein product [Rotaria sordida]